MLIVRTNDGCNIPTSVRTRRPFTVPEILSIVHVTADGEDLEYVKEHFSVPIPIPLHRDSVTWFGDHARFIVGNL